MSGWVWRAYVAAGVVFGAAHFAVRDPNVQGGLYLGLALSGIIAILVGLRRHRPAYRTPWLLFAGGLSVFLAGDLFFYWSKLVRHVERPFPSVADACYLASYPLLIAGLLLLVRRRTPGGDTKSLIDAAVISTAMGTLSWVYLMAPALAPGMPVLERVISVGYPLMDVMLLAVAVRLAFTAGARRHTYYLVGVAVVCLLAADVAYAVIQLTGSFDLGTPFDAGWMGFYLCWGAAALHPSMRTLADPAPPTDAGFSRLRVALLAGVVLVAPGVLTVEAARGSYSQVPVIAAGSMVLFLLVIARLAGLMGATLQTATRERAMRRVAAALVATTDRESIYQAVIRAVCDLAPGRAVAVRLVYGRPDDVRVVAREDGPAPAGEAVPNELLHPSSYRPGERLRPVELAGLHVGLDLSSTTTTVLLGPILVQGVARGAVVLGAEGPLPDGVGEALATIASQLGLALESALATEDRHLRQSEARFRSLVQNSSDAITLVDAAGIVRYQTPSVEHVLGYHPDDLTGTCLVDLIHPDDALRAAELLETAATAPGVRPPVQLQMRHSDGRWLDVETISNNMLADGNVQGIVLTTRDISERKSFERQLTHQALHDPLTGLANRALFIDRIEHALSRQVRDRALLAVLFIDLDDFKTVNDGLGHTVGDQALVAVAERLAGCLRTGDTAARLGGDEFGILLEGVESSAAAEEVGQRVLAKLREPLVVEGSPIGINASVGVVLTSGDDDATELLRKADVAMYKAKGRGKGRLEVFEIGMHAAVLERLALKADLARAVEREEFVTHYQPVVHLGTGLIVGMEALIRWNHPTRGLVAPSEFIGLAEETGDIVAMGLGVLRAACRQLREWGDHSGMLRVSVNLSASQLQDPSLVADVARVLEESAIDPARVTLEITESLLMSDTDAALATLRRLKSLGVNLALDDFGTGYSSLSYLQRFPVDELKLDKTFVDNLGQPGEDSRLARAIIGLGRMLNLAITAEGIESEAQLRRLRQLGCRMGQGYYFAPPVAASEMEALLRADDAISDAVAELGASPETLPPAS